MAKRRRPHVLIIVQNLPVPLDRRVWLESQALSGAGFAVSVICPKGPGDPARQRIQGIDIYKYRPPREAQGVLGFAWEFIYSWLRTGWLSIVVWRHGRFDIIQACNPPDTYWALARLWRARHVKFVYDQHDLNPELFLSRFGVPRSPKAMALLGALRWLERQTYRTADHVISTNDFYREIAIRRGGRPLSDTTVVRSGPDTRRMRPVIPPLSVRGAHRYLLAYLGVMGPQDTVGQLIDVMEDLVRRRGRTDIHLVLMGFGDCLEELRSDVTARGLDDAITFTGRVGPAEIADHLSAADIGLGPDLRTPLNDVSTMNKTLEYMAYCLPSVAYELAEARRLVDNAAVFVPSGDVKRFADEVVALLADPDRRVQMGLRARERVVNLWDWRAQSAAYIKVFDRLTDSSLKIPRGTESPVRGAMHSLGETVGSRSYVNLEDRVALAHFIRDRAARPAEGTSTATA